MDGFDLNKIPKTYFVLEFKGPGGYIPLGYTKYTLPIMMQYKFKNTKDADFTAYHASTSEPVKYYYNRTAEFSNHVVNHTKNTQFVLTKDIKNNIKSHSLNIIHRINLKWKIFFRPIY